MFGIMWSGPCPGGAIYIDGGRLGKASFVKASACTFCPASVIKWSFPNPGEAIATNGDKLGKDSAKLD